MARLDSNLFMVLICPVSGNIVAVTFRAVQDVSAHIAPAASPRREVASMDHARAGFPNITPEPT